MGPHEVVELWCRVCLGAGLAACDWELDMWKVMCRSCSGCWPPALEFGEFEHVCRGRGSDALSRHGYADMQSRCHCCCNSDRNHTWIQQRHAAVLGQSKSCMGVSNNLIYALLPATRACTTVAWDDQGVTLPTPHSQPLSQQFRLQMPSVGRAHAHAHTTESTNVQLSWPQNS